jgi:putative membrane protein
MIFTLIVALILAVVSVVFALQNPDVIKVSFFTLKMEGPFALFILASLAIGAVIGILVMVPSVIKNAITISRHRKQIDGLQKSMKEMAPPAEVTPKPQMTAPEPVAPASGKSDAYKPILPEEADQIEE